MTVQYGGKVNSSERRHASVMEEVPFGLMRSILMALVELPVTDGSSDIVQGLSYGGLSKQIVEIC